MTSSIKWCTIIFLALAVGCTSQDVFSEELLTAWLSPQHLLVHLHFDQATTASRLHTSFPHAIQHLAAVLPLHDVELSLTSGRWRFTEWGWPLLPAKPVGAVLEASFHSGLAAAAVTAHWAALVNALSGLSCASLSLLTDPSAIAVGGIGLREVLGPAAADNCSAAEPASRGPGWRLQAMLPHEPLCTENLTPWLRLLPCRDQAGLAALLRHRPTVFGAEYVSLGLRVERRTTRRGRRAVRLVQTFTLVLRTAPHLRPAAESGAPAQTLDLEEVVSADVEHFCPAAARSEVLVAEPEGPAAAAWAAWGGGGACSLIDDGLGHGSCRPGPETDSARSGPSGAGGRNGSSLLLLPLSDVAATTPGLALFHALPLLRRYDTLELLEMRGRALGLRLPYPPPRSAATLTTARAAAGQVRASGDDRAGEAPQMSSGPASELWVERYMTGAGLLRGGLVLRVQRFEGLRARLAASCRAAGDAAEEGAGGGAVCAAALVCVAQVLPWYVQPWIHTLAVLYDGQEVPLRPHVVAQRLRPAVRRASPGLLDVCLAVPPAVSEVQLRLAFSKAFLTVFEYPPDAHRGFDVPAAAVSYLDPLHAPAVTWRAVGEEGGGGGGGTGFHEGGGEVEISPLLAALSRGAVQQVYTSGLLVPLAAPDFSMPYNVICLSSTVLAVYFGVVLNLLITRGRSGDEGAGAASSGREGASARGKVLQAVAMVGLFCCLALYLDSELREHVQGLLAGLGLRGPGAS